MSAFKRWTAVALSLALAVSISISSALAVPAAEPFADFRIDAADMDVPDRILSIDVYRQSEDENEESEPLQAAENQDYDCKVNRVTGNASFYIQPQADGVRVTVDYLTDLDGDGVYELLDGGDNPAWDALDPQGNLVRGGLVPLVNGQTYILTAETLAARFEETVQSRALDQELDSVHQSFPLCRITLHRTAPDDGQEYAQIYYLEIHGQVLIPADISRDQWYYSAVEYSLVNGWFTGLEDGRFNPDEPLNRAQLAQVLWAAEGRPAAEAADFTDVTPEDWFCQAVAWCQQEGLIAGYADGTFLPDSPLTREQLVSILYRYAKYTGSNLRLTGDLSQYVDREAVSPWAWDSMRWAAVNQLLITPDGNLHPQDTVTRAELAAALYAYKTSQTPRSRW